MDSLFRATSTRVLPPVRELPDGSYLSVLLAPNLPTKGDQHRAKGGRCPRLGIKKRRERGLLVRVVEAEITVIPEQGETRCETYRLITTVLDPNVATARDIVTLYHQRWESEVGFADLKTYLRGGQNVLRSQSPDGVAQELYALLVVYQLVQIARSRAARDHPAHDHLDPDRISFTVVLRAIIRTVGEETGTGHLLHDVFKEVWNQPLLDRRPRAKPHELKGTPAFTRAVASTPPGRVTLKIATRRPQVPEA